jgi:hypothetical protein
MLFIISAGEISKIDHGIKAGQNQKFKGRPAMATHSQAQNMQSLSGKMTIRYPSGEVLP